VRSSGFRRNTHIIQYNARFLKSVDGLVDDALGWGMEARVVFLARTKAPDLFLPVEVRKNRPIEPECEIYGYYLRYRQDGKRKVEPVGKDITVAYAAYRNRELNHTRVRMGLEPIHGAAALVHDFRENADKRVRIADAAAKYLRDLTDNVQTGDRARSTLQAYKVAVEDFRDHCGVTFMDQINAEVLQAHKLYLHRSIKKRVRGKKANTVAKRFRYLSAFLGRQGLQIVKTRRPGSSGLMNWSDFPREEKKQNIDRYSEEEVKGMLSVATLEEADLIHTFLRTGFRDEEVAYMLWTDVDWKRKQITIDEKPQYGWKPKDKERRVVPLEDGVLLTRLAARRKRQRPQSLLVFPNTLGSADMHLIRKLHKVVAKMKKKKLEIEGDPTLHRFRRTYASMMISHSDLQTVSDLLGHSDIETTAGYLAPDQAKARVGTRTAFKAIDK
jgi:integrase